MFSYSCEKCGMEVPPAYQECPNCAANAAQAASAATGVPIEPSVTPPAVTAHQAPPQQPVPLTYYPPAGVPPGTYPPAPVPQGTYPQAPMPQGVYLQTAMPQPQMPPTVVGPPPPQQHAQPYYAPPPPAPPQPRGGTPPWLVTLLVAIVFLLGGYVAYTQLLPKYRESQSAAGLETPSAAADAAPEAGAPHKLNKYLEVAGVRIVEEGRKPVVKVTIVNHSAAELTDITGVIELHTTAEKAGSGPLGQVPLKIGSIGAYEAKEVSLPFTTKLRAYEMPDWQFVRAELKEVAR